MRMNNLLLLVIVLFGLYFVCRMPLLRQPLGYEEGQFAELLANKPPGPAYLLMGRINGKNIYGIAEHPAFIYETFKAVGKLGSTVIEPAKVPTDSQTWRLRLAVSLVAFISWGLLITYLIFYYEMCANIWLVAAIVAVMLSPIAVFTSTQLQVDGSVGLLMTGLTSILLLVGARRRKYSFLYYFALALSCFWLASGKQEWSMALLLALVTCFVYLLTKGRIMEVVTHKWLFVAIGAGLVLGNVNSFLYDPQNYLGDFGIFQYYLCRNDGIDQWISAFLAKLPMTITSYALLLAVWLITIFDPLKKEQFNPAAIILLGLGCFLLAGFTLGTKLSVDPRYFSPATFALACALVMVVPVNHPLWQSRLILIILTVLVFACDGQYFVNQLKNSPRAQDVYLARTITSHCVPLIDDGVAWNKTHMDFIGSGLGFEAGTKLAARFGKKLCCQ